MSTTLYRIERFIEEHHVLTLASLQDDIPQCANLFFAYDALTQCFIVASDTRTQHIQNVLNHSMVAGSIVLETKSVGKIQGLQFSAQMQKTEDDKNYTLYYKEFPYARVLQPQLWKIKIFKMKFTDNSLGFGKKLLWEGVNEVDKP